LGLGTYIWADKGIYKGEWKNDRMNGFGRLVKDGIDILGEFYADHFSREIPPEDLEEDLKAYILS
jgi:hypothetical protein